jgi:prolyl oligopeptidase
MMPSKFKTLLLLGSALMLSACGAGEVATDKMTEKASEAADTMKAKATKMIEYTAAGQTDEDHLYLEEVLGDKALADVTAWNERSLERLKADPRFAAMEAEALEILQSKDKIPYVSFRGGEVHNFWQDATHVRGIWRKSTLESYLTATPKWETVLDYDKLSADEDKNWVYKGNSCLPPE